MPPKRALEAMGRLIREGTPQAAAIPVDWSKYREFSPSDSVPALLSELAAEAAATPSQTVRRGEMRDAILDADPNQRLQLLQTYLSQQVARVLGLSPLQLDIQQPLTNLGLDSLMAVELKNRISTDLGVNVPMVKFLQGFSVAQAATQLLGQLAAEAGDPADRQASAPEAPGENGSDRFNEAVLADIDELSDEQVNSMLTRMLTKDAVTSE